MNEVEIVEARDAVSPSLRNEIEYKLPVVDKLSSNAIFHFYFEYCNGRKTDFRKCVKCGEKLMCPNAGTSSLHRHHKLCSKNALRKRPSDQSQLKYNQNCNVLMNKNKSLLD